MRYYLHTIDTRPATFDGEQLVFATEHPHWQDAPTPAVPVATLAQLAREQEASRRFRAAHRWEAFDYGYAVLDVPAVPAPRRRRTRAVSRGEPAR